MPNNAITSVLSAILETAPPDPTVTKTFGTSSQLPLPPCYGPSESEGEWPGQYPFARGVTSPMYHDAPWVMGMYSGYGSPRETRDRFRSLLEAGQTGLSIALDLPTQIGIDSDDPLAAGEVGKVGVPLNTVEDMISLLDGLPLSKVQQMRTTANSIAPIFTAFAIVALEELGVETASFRLFTQNDPLKEFTSRGTWIFPPQPSMKFAVDVVEYFAKHHPTWQPIQFCGYHIRDAGGNAVQEVSVSALNGIAYLDEAERRGVDLSALAPQLFLFLSASVDFFEEAAKFRAARRLWAKILHQRYGVPREKAAIKIFAYTLGGALTAQEPLNNIVRVAYEALGAALGGVQTLATSSWDEAHSLPSEEAAHLALRTQQILALESGVTKVVDPLGGAWYLENLTDRLEAAFARETLALIEAGGAIAGIESGRIVEALAASAYQDYRDVEEGRRVLVGVNYMPAAQPARDPRILSQSSSAVEDAVRSVRAVRSSRDALRLEQSLAVLRQAAAAGKNTIPFLIAAARARATIGELTATLATVFGRHVPSVERALENCGR